jgi:hypothetical protein
MRVCISGSIYPNSGDKVNVSMSALPYNPVPHIATLHLSSPLHTKLDMHMHASNRLTTPRPIESRRRVHHGSAPVRAQARACSSSARGATPTRPTAPQHCPLAAHCMAGMHLELLGREAHQSHNHILLLLGSSAQHAQQHQPAHHHTCLSAHVHMRVGKSVNPCVRPRARTYLHMQWRARMRTVGAARAPRTLLHMHVCVRCVTSPPRTSHRTRPRAGGITCPGSSKPQFGVVENMLRAVVRILNATRCPSTLMSRMILLTDCVPQRMCTNRAPSISARSISTNTALLRMARCGVPSGAARSSPCAHGELLAASDDTPCVLTRGVPR